MVFKRSEYRHQFKVSSLEKNIPVYTANVNYRHLRRERECSHTPISWDGDQVDSDSDDRATPDREANSLPVAEIAIIEEEKEEEEDEADEADSVKLEKQAALKLDAEKQAAVKSDSVKQKTASKDKSEVVIEKQDDALRKSAVEKLTKYVCKENMDEPVKGKEVESKAFGKTFVKPTKVDDKLFVARSKPRRPDRFRKIPKCRPVSAPTGRPSVEKTSKSVPFVAYGCGDSERVTGEQKTFNVRASSAVYPAALRAKKRNQLQVEKALEKQRSASAREKKRKALFNQKMARETATWDTEYRRNYPAYDNTQYAISGPSKSPRKQKSFFVT